MKVDCIYVNTYRYDYLLLRICIASIRYWYPNIPIFLIKDLASGNFNTTALEKKWNVQVMNTSIKYYGWGFGKLEPLFISANHQFLVLDSDTVLTGFVLDAVNDIEADFIVDEEIQSAEEVKRLYYDIEKVKDLLPGFSYPGYTFNSGQWFGTTNQIKLEDFESLLDWKRMPELKYPACFMPGDQGVLNLIIHNHDAKGNISVKRKKIMVWPKDGGADFIQIEDLILKKNSFPFVIHWAGLKKKNLTAYDRFDILNFYLDYFKEDFSLSKRILFNMKKKYLKIEQKLRFRIKVLFQIKFG